MRTSVVFARVLIASVAFLAFLTVPGCSIPQNTRYGADLSSIKDPPLVKGETTQTSMIQRFGQPQSSSTSADGTETLTWIDNRSTGHVDAADIWWGGRHISEVTNDSLMAIFRDGKLVDYTLSHQGTPANYQGHN